MAGLGSLIQGFQQGYEFVDDMQRRQTDDQFKGEQRDRLRKDWSKEDDYESARKALVARHFGAEGDKPAPADDANPSRVLAMQQGADPQAGAVAAPEVAVTPVTTPPNVAAPTPVAQVAGAGRGFVNPPGPVGAGRGNINPPVVTAADRAVAPGQVDLAKMTPQQKQDLMTLAEKQFGLRHSAAPTALAQGGALQNVAAPPTPVPGVRLAADGVDTPVQTRPTRVDPSQDMNKTLNFALESAKLDVQYGKKDGAGLITLAKTVDSMKREGMDQAIKLLGQGRYQEAQDLFNSQGDHTGVTVISAKDSTFNVGKTAIPTKIVTLRKEDGTTRTINTAEAQYQMIDMAKQIEVAQKDRTADITEKHYDAVLNEQKLARQDRQTVHQDAQRNADREFSMRERQYKDGTVDGKMAQITSALGPLTPDEDKAYRKKLLGIGKDAESRLPFYQKVVEESVKAGITKAEDSGKMLSRLVAGDKVADDEGIVSKELIANKGDPVAYARSYELATKIMPPARLKELGFEAPKPQKAAGAGAKLATMASPEAADRVPDPPPQFIQTGLSRMANPAYADWAKTYADAYGQQQAKKQEGYAGEKKRADAYNPFQQPKL